MKFSPGNWLILNFQLQITGRAKPVELREEDQIEITGPKKPIMKEKVLYLN
jgi:hypothetical protein